MTAKPRVVVVGLGPGDPDLVTAAARSALERAPRSFLGSASSLRLLELPYPQLAATDPAGVVEALVAAARAAGEVAYGVAGSPQVLEPAVALLRRDERVEVVVVPGVSFCELAWDRLGIDPALEPSRVVAAGDLAVIGPQVTGSLVVALSGAGKAELDLVPRAAGDTWPELAVVLQRLGLPGERVEEVPFDEALAALRDDDLTSLFVPAPAGAGSFAAAGAELARLASLVATLRERCPWDREQTHASLVRHLLEEAYEAMEAIDGLSHPPTPAQAAHFEEEIGDLLCQVYFHATLAAETGSFDLESVARALREKLVARHPHVFGDRVARDAGMVVANWERGKLGEKGRTSLMDGIPPAMPALAAAVKVERKAAGAGLGFAETGDPAGVKAHLEELLDVLAPAVGEEQLGELLLEVARMAAAAGLDAEGALRRATGRFKERFVAAEGAAAEKGALLHDLAPGERLQLWHRC